MSFRIQAGRENRTPGNRLEICGIATIRYPHKILISKLSLVSRLSLDISCLFEKIKTKDSVLMRIHIEYLITKIHIRQMGYVTLAANIIGEC